MLLEYQTISGVGPGSALLAIMVGTAVFAGVFSITSQKISRLEGLGLLAMFLVYVLLSL